MTDIDLQAIRDQGKTVAQIEAEIRETIADDAAYWRKVYGSLMPSNLEDALRDAYEHGAQSCPQRIEDQDDE